MFKFGRLLFLYKQCGNLVGDLMGWLWRAWQVVDICKGFLFQTKLMCNLVHLNIDYNVLGRFVDGHLVDRHLVDTTFGRQTSRQQDFSSTGCFVDWTFSRTDFW